MKIYDRVYLGTSPVSCIDSIYYKLKNKNVILIDERNSFGGGWTSIKYQGLPFLEIGCHIWSIDNKVFAFISRFLKLPLVRMNPQPILIRNNLSFPYDWKLNIITIKKLLSNIFKCNFKAIRNDFSNPSFRFSILPSKYFYPLNGATLFVNKIRNKLNENDVSYKLNTKINRIKIEKNRINLYTENDVIICSSVVLTSLSNFESVEFHDGNVIKPKSKSVKYIHMHIVIEGDFKKNFSYVRVLNDNLIHRISDITNQIDDKYLNGKRVIIVGVLEDAFDKNAEKDLKYLIFKRLVKLNFLSSSNKLYSSFINCYPSFYNDVNELKEIKHKSNGMIEFLPSTDLIYSFSKQLKKWESLFFAGSE